MKINQIPSETSLRGKLLQIVLEHELKNCLFDEIKMNELQVHISVVAKRHLKFDINIFDIAFTEGMLKGKVGFTDENYVNRLLDFSVAPTHSPISAN